ncbi:hypothetical protein M0813_05498 [Anaeramoeba flamelloides]|uniref:Uncharacterized protein n=1 Tax=Anaeramoeba flamelloides TaxID=1746091 RepID=A0ABQ8XID4_9EUKA|nr:hypothetical protein M0813_05498 [Anaeramoeba flamelloides]
MKLLLLLVLIAACYAEDSIYMTHGRYYESNTDCTGDDYVDFTRIDGKCYPSMQYGVFWNVSDPEVGKEFDFFSCDNNKCSLSGCTLAGKYEHNKCAAIGSGSWFFRVEKFDRTKVNVANEYYYEESTDCTNNFVLNSLVQTECYNIYGKTSARFIIAGSDKKKLYIEESKEMMCKNPVGKTVDFDTCYPEGGMSVKFELEPKTK